MTLTAHIQPTTILLATDGSPRAQAAAQGLTTWSLSSNSQVVVLTAAPLLQIAPRADLYLEFRDRETREVNVALSQALATLGQSGIRAEPMIRCGRPADVILGTAGEINANMIVMGARSDTAEPGGPIGSVAHRIVKCARKPVLVIRPPARNQRLLLATDGSPAAGKALDFLALWSWPRGVTVTVTHVCAAAEERARAQAIVDRAAARLRAANLPADGYVAVGHPATEILEVAKQVKTDLIIVGARRLNAVQRILLGSVSSRVARFAPHSVLVVR